MTQIPPAAETRLGVVIVTFNSTDVVLENLESLMAQNTEVALDIVVVDNGSTDDTLPALRAWATGKTPFLPPDDLPFTLAPCPKPVVLAPPEAGCPDNTADTPGLTLIETGLNSGFAGGVNRGLAHLQAHSPADRYWILNPDATVAPGTVRAFAIVNPGPFSLMGGRVIYTHTPDVIQIDGGTVNRRTGISGNLNQGQSHAATPPPDIADMDFIMGASMIASREFYETAGPMPEDYFLYYEEVDWAWQRGDLPFAYCADGVVYHRAGTSIGSPTLERVASPFSLYFKHRSRRLFIKRHLPGAMATAWVYTLLKAGQYLLKGYRAETRAMWDGFRGAPPPADIRAKLSPEAQARAFAPLEP